MKNKNHEQPGPSTAEVLDPRAEPNGGLPAEIPAINFAQDAGKGTETADRKSFAIPFLMILQGQSPELEKIDGARPGMFYNNITNELFKEAFVIPCAFRRRFIRWAPREDGGGYKGEFDPIDVETGKVEGMTKDQDDQRYYIGDDFLSDTRNHFVLVRSEKGGWSPAVLSLKSTQIKKSKRWMSRIQSVEMTRVENGVNISFNPASYSHVYRLRSVKEENTQGAWWGVEVDMVGPVTDAQVYGKAKTFSLAVNAGEVETAVPQTDTPVDGRF